MTLSTDLRYPVGRFSAPASKTYADFTAAIDVLRQLPRLLTAAVDGLDDSQLDTPYRDGGWTVRQVVHHLADSHLNSYIRFKLALTENWPTIKAYDQEAWANLPDSKMPVQVSLDLATAVHARWVALLESMTEEQFELGFTHPIYGSMTLAHALAMYDWHSRHHVGHINGLRSRMGW
ncbi:YfiT family bacillithiol transferase [Acidicapsa ligni]|uniref:YfiT family bacillithiol transferase n=1 Tax=Acidicapsa ligni TaxID=542300 RepID=UPI0021DF4A23|nr:bacillithiol transferase BstA [Acidicapsa ligni]